MVQGYCSKCKNFPEYLLADTYLDLEILPLAYNDGSASNTWADGTVGITTEIAEAVNDCESMYCPECLAEIDWLHN
jgi:hypothetical protein